MPYNTELFGKVYDQIASRPETHCQADWVAHRDTELCETVRCAGGWAVHFTHPDVHLWAAAGLILGVRLCGANMSGAAQKVLGLNDEEASELFYDASDEQAVALCAFYAGHRPDKISIHEEN